METASNKISPDELISVHIRFFLKYHYSIASCNNLLKLNPKLIEYPLTLNIIKDYYMYISYQIKIIPILHKWKLMYKNPFFWKLNLTKQIIYLLKLKDKFMAQFDCSKGMIYFHLRLKDSSINSYHVEEMIERLESVYQMFKFNFFNINKIILCTVQQFTDMEFKKKIDYIEYIFCKIKRILEFNIYNFQIYEFYRNQLDNLLNPIEPIDISINDVSSEIEMDDVIFIFS